MVKFELEDDEIIALMHCASVGSAASQALLGANARQMQPIFQKINEQFTKQREQADPRGNGRIDGEAPEPVKRSKPLPPELKGDTRSN
jgi:hypothetical protein